MKNLVKKSGFKQVLFCLFLSLFCQNSICAFGMYEDTRTQSLDSVEKKVKKSSRFELSMDYTNSSGNFHQENKGLGLFIYNKKQNLYLTGSYRKHTFSQTIVLQDRKNLMFRKEFAQKGAIKWYFISTYSSNIFLSLDSRQVFGFGPWRDYKYKKWENGVSVALAWDRERYLQNAIRETNTSLSFRDLGSYTFDEETSLGYDLMYIPTIDEWSRYRIFTAFWLDNKLNKRVTLRLKYSYEKNSFRIPGVNDTDREVTTSLVYSF